MKLFNEPLLNIFSKIKTFRDSDPPWINDDIKSKIKLKHKLYHRYLRHKRNKEVFVNVEHLRNEIDNLISKSKKECYQNMNRKLNNSLTSNKNEWSIMKTFFNDKKAPVIPPLLFNGAFVTDFEEKAKIFNSSFAKQCTKAMYKVIKTLWHLVLFLPSGIEEILLQSIRRRINK